MERKTFLMTSSFYPPYHIGGDAVHVKYLSEELVKLGHEVHVMFRLDAYRYKISGFKRTLKEIEKINGVNLHPIQSPSGRYDLYLTYLFGNSPYIRKRFGCIIDQIKPDVVHHHNIFFLGHDILKKQGNYVNLYTAHDYWLICQRSDLMKYGKSECSEKKCLYCSLWSKRLPQIWRSKRSFKESVGDIDNIIAPSMFMKEKLSERMPLKPDIAHISNFVPAPPEIIKNSNYSNFFLYVGVLEKHKGICSMLKLFKELNMSQDARLIIVGRGSLKKSIERYIKKNKLEKRIILLGWVSSEMLFSLYKDALALFVPSIWPENNPLVALEALSVNTPVIGRNTGGIAEIIEKIERNFIFKNDGYREVRMILDKKNFMHDNRIKEIYNEYYSPVSYLKKYNKLL